MGKVCTNENWGQDDLARILKVTKINLEKYKLYPVKLNLPWIKVIYCATEEIICGAEVRPTALPKPMSERNTLKV